MTDFHDDYIYFTEGFVKTSDYFAALLPREFEAYNRKKGFAITNLVALGTGPEGERMSLERVNDSCWFVHCPGNSKSPFEFTTEGQARQFADLLTMQRIGELL